MIIAWFIASILLMASYLWHRRRGDHAKRNKIRSDILQSISDLGGRATALQIYSHVGNAGGDEAFVDMHDHLNVIIAQGHLRCDLVAADTDDGSYRRTFVVTHDDAVTVRPNAPRGAPFAHETDFRAGRVRV